MGKIIKPTTIVLITLDSNTGSDRVISHYAKVLRDLSIDTEVWSPGEVVRGLLPGVLWFLLQRLPAKRWFTQIIFEFWLALKILRKRKNTNIRVISFVYPLLPISLFCSRILRIYEYWFWVPDLMYRKQYVSSLRWYIFSIFSAFAIKLADKVLVPSASAQLDISTFFGQRISSRVQRLDAPIDQEKMERLHPQPVADLVDKAFIFHPAGNKPNKNTKRAIEAFQLLRRDVNGRQDSYFVCLANSVNSVAGPVNLDMTNVITVEHATDEQMKWLYLNCEFVSVVSIEEGVGLPVLEGQYFEKLVVTSFLSAMPETSSGRAVFIDPFSVSSMTKGYQLAFEKHKSVLPHGNVSPYGSRLHQQFFSLTKIKK